MKKNTLLFLIILLWVLGLGSCGLYYAMTKIIPARQYAQAEELFENQEFDEAAAMFEHLGDYEDAAARVPQVYYEKGLWLRRNARYDEAMDVFRELGDYQGSYALDAKAQIHETELIVVQNTIDSGKYAAALTMLEDMEPYASAIFTNTMQGCSTDDLWAQAVTDRAGILESIGKLDNAASELLKITEEAGTERTNITDDTLSEADRLLKDVYYRKASNALLVSDFETAADYFDMAGNYKDAVMQRATLDSVFDFVYEAPYADGSGNVSQIATSYLWIHTRLVAGSEYAELIMEEDFATGKPDPLYFGAGVRTYTQTAQENEFIFTFSYKGSAGESEQDRETNLIAAFTPDYQLINTKKIFADTLEDIEYPSSRNWQIVTDEETAELVKEGFRRKTRINLARKGYPAFADETDDAAISHYCCEENCTNVGTVMVTDAGSRKYYCEEHKK